MEITNNILHSGTVIGTGHRGLTKTEVHWDVREKEMVVIDTWYVTDGEDDVAQEFEVVAKFTNIKEFVESPYYKLIGMPSYE